MTSSRSGYLSGVSDEDWGLVAPYLTLLREDAEQREHGLREVFNGLRYVVKAGAPWRWMPNDLPPWEAVYQQAQRWLAAGCFASNWPTTFELAEAVQAATGDHVDLAYVDQSYIGEKPAKAAREHPHHRR